MRDKRAIFLDKAAKLKPVLTGSEKRPVSRVVPRPGSDHIWSYEKVGDAEGLGEVALGKGDRICLDFGTHNVGYVSFDILYSGSPPDAPVYMRLKFGEKICEIGEDSADYEGALCSSWIQEEYIHIDVIPSKVALERRYAFRFMEIYIKDLSSRHKVHIENVVCRAVSSGRMENVPKLGVVSDKLAKIDRVSVRTMHECMQDVFEDGPKRDRRLWLGDLRLQALTNYYTFKNDALVKRCLYLFAGTADEEGKISACLFTQPEVVGDDTYLFDYSLFFISCLHDYYFATGDGETLKELWEMAYRQIELSVRFLDDRMLVKDRDDWWCFIDWNDELNKQASAQAVFIYTAKQALTLSKICGAEKQTEYIQQLVDKLSDSACKYLWDETQGFFISGKEKQVSWASQIWFVLAGVFDQETNKALIERLVEKKPQIKMVTPYMYHYFVDACMCCGMEAMAEDLITDYWGSMVEDGADCFYEIYDINDKSWSPYGSLVINSYCHAWSGTPSYFIRKYLVK